MLDSDFELTHNGEFYGENPYYAPEKCGLKLIAQIELEEASYSFNTRVVWKHENGKLYTAQDSGCSCPTPFEDYHRLSDLTELTRESLDAIKSELREHTYVSPATAQEFLYKIRDAR